MADEYKPAGDPMGVWNHPMHDLQTRLEICAGAVEHQAAIAANMRRQRNDLRALLEHWAHIGHLQTFEDRERFRKAARDLLDNPLGASGVAPTAPTPRPATVAEAQHAAEIGACLPNGVLFDAFGNPRTRYTRVIADGSTCVCDDVQVREWREDEARTPGTYVFQDVYLSKEEFDGLPEFDGF